MIKVVYCLRRREGMSAGEFRAHWRDVHGPLVRRHADALKIKRYIQVETDFGAMTERLGRFRGTGEPYDGVAEICYESLEALRELGKDPGARAASRALFEDERKFVDFARSAIWVGEEREVIS